MKYTQLGSSDLKVSRICMGCMGFPFFAQAARFREKWDVWRCLQRSAQLDC